MKIRSGFVTNSSSSSYLILYKLSDKDRAREYIAEEFGKNGLVRFDEANTDALGQAEAFYKERMKYSYRSALAEASDEQKHDAFVEICKALGIDPSGEYVMYTEDWDYGSNSWIEFIMKALPDEFKEKRFVHDQFKL